MNKDKCSVKDKIKEKLKFKHVPSIFSNVYSFVRYLDCFHKKGSLLKLIQDDSD